ncbi:DUF6191 domain-containing protein [Streptomyces sp. Je 1-4]|uniref:DUF6191 domain-containing protein n=1 Tax=Streptomyces TaxID=1883 RepID=UPI0021DAA225|nr:MULTISPECIES: DUF6191 domain-containing protein [unclassified Streptomyces]UYB45084.1 DUF6191 domain-containing protein [Streptomyces sp. Je 1-4]UZQ40913.1 DUF6191 domain-containing protein [Streptomyces sp. Je 1-4] [Streptomyces sp. Je 1-4 4N24]UZQ48330.1 DUF6191 domain-containing protein [Streptomyces sp. Je 1-4] [Streptomyces sp. Je 1-4 4N24_ara]
MLLFAWVIRRRRKFGGGGATSGAWDELFQPSQQHVQEEKERRLVLRDDAESGAPPRSTVDLQSGLAVIRPEPTHEPGER